MKKLILLFASFTFLSGKTQITLDHSYPAPTHFNYSFALQKLGISGYKYVEIDQSLGTINVYNINHTLYKSFAAPNVFQGGSGTIYIYFISENLFNSDNLIEYVFQAYPNSTIGGPVYIYNENGIQIFKRDSAVINTTDDFSGKYFIFNDGNSAKMHLSIYNSNLSSFSKDEIYTLPGVITCYECLNTSPTTGITRSSSDSKTDAVFYPNPVTENLKLRYILPKDCKAAEIQISDLQGKLIETLKVTDRFDHIYLPTNYNNGMYLYSLIIDGHIVKTEKIVLNK